MEEPVDARESNRRDCDRPQDLWRARRGQRHRLGTTVATNALLEGKGATLAYVTTGGFKDVPFIGRGNRRHHYDLASVKPKPSVAVSSMSDC